MKYIAVGGLIAAGFDASGRYLLVVSHAGRGVFSTDSWERVARNSEVCYPKDGFSVGIGPIDGISIQTKEIDYESGVLRLHSEDRLITLDYDSGTLSIRDDRNEKKK